MGNYVSKCCGNAKKYKGKHEVKVMKQPEQDDTEVKIATNAGATKTLPFDNQPTVTPKEIQDDKAKEKKKENNDDKKEDTQAKKGHKKHKRTDRQKYIDSSEDSSDFWSSSSSESSSSDSDTGHVKSSRKVYKNKGGGTTIVSKKTIIGGNKMTIGKNARNVTINIGNNKNEPEVKQSSPSRREETKPFDSFYTESSASEEEKRQFASSWGQNAAPPGGNFIDTRDVHVQEYVFEAGVRVDASSWVCMICFPGRNGRGEGRATGFRVGPRYIMTANHVVKEIQDSGYQQLGQNQDPFSPLQGPGVYVVFNFTIDSPVSERQTFHFKATVPFFDDATDTAILELEDNSLGTAMPLSFTYFSLPRLNNRFTFIGHSLGDRMAFNHVEKIIDTNSTETQRNILQVKQMSLQHSGKDYEFQPHNTLTNPDRFLFHCKFTKGGSGSPGVVTLQDGRVVVVTMLLCGLPDWYYGTSVPDNVKIGWPKEYCVEQGVNLKSVYEKMSRDNPTLCREIFSNQTDTIPNPNL